MQRVIISIVFKNAEVVHYLLSHLNVFKCIASITFTIEMFKGGDIDADQAAEAELLRLQKQVSNWKSPGFYRIPIYDLLLTDFQLRKMELDRRTFIDEKSRKHAKRQKIIERLRAERNVLRDRVTDLQTGPHAKRSHQVQNMKYWFKIPAHLFNL